MNSPLKQGVPSEGRGGAWKRQFMKCCSWGPCWDHCRVPPVLHLLHWFVGTTSWSTSSCPCCVVRVGVHFWCLQSKNRRCCALGATSVHSMESPDSHSECLAGKHAPEDKTAVTEPNAASPTLCDAVCQREGSHC